MKKLIMSSLAIAAAAFAFGDKPDAEGFVSIFNGKDLAGWVGSDAYCVEMCTNKLNSGAVSVFPVLACQPGKGSGGNLSTVKQYENFILRFEFCMPVNANNGLGIRMPAPDSHAAYDAMCELQILDDGGDQYTKLQPYQYHGSIYGIVPSLRDNVGK